MVCDAHVTPDRGRHPLTLYELVLELGRYDDWAGDRRTGRSGDKNSGNWSGASRPITSRTTILNRTQAVTEQLCYGGGFGQVNCFCRNNTCCISNNNFDRHVNTLTERCYAACEQSVGPNYLP